MAVAVTGHLESSASPNGAFAYIALGNRLDQEIQLATVVEVSLIGKDRTTRQWQAASEALKVANEYLRGICI